MNNDDRINYIDGLKGLLAVLVVFCHLSCVFLPGLYYLEKASNNFELTWINSPLNIITNGTFSVQFFFVISGFLITRNVLKKEKSSLGIIKIYQRMLKIVVPAVLFSYILMKFGLMNHQQALAINDKLEFLASYNNFEPSIFGAIKDIVLTFVKGSSYNGPLWTVVHEVFGSVMIYALSSFIKNLDSNRKIVYIVVMIASIPISTMISPFIWGALVSECIYGKKEDSLIDKVLEKITNKKLFLFILMLFGLYFATINMYTTGFWSIFRIIPVYEASNNFIRSCGIAIILFCLNYFESIKDILSKKTFTFFGKISPYIYIFHWPIILSLGCFIYIRLYQIDYFTCVFIITLSVIITTVVISILYKTLEFKVRTIINNKTTKLK